MSKYQFQIATVDQVLTVFFLGDPFRYHAHYIIRVIEWTEKLSPLDLVAFGRLAVSVNKSPVIASIDPTTNTLTYNTLQWCK